MSDDKYEYGQELKIIRFSVTDDDHARLLTKLRNYNLRVSHTSVKRQIYEILETKEKR